MSSQLAEIGRHGLSQKRALPACVKNPRILLANSPDWLKAEPIRENLLASWR
jgi:hypothetical protein